MTHTYTPGLMATARTKVTRERILPLTGDVLVDEGDAVTAETIVARAKLPGDVTIVNAVSKLGCEAGELTDYMLKSEGAEVQKDELIAETRPFIKMFRSQLKSPIDGVLESISQVTGQIILRGQPKPVEMSAYYDGRVSRVMPGEGVDVETSATFVQGIFGIGGEVTGELAMVCDAPDQALEASALSDEHRGKIVVGGSFVSGETLKKAVSYGVAAIVIGGFHDRDLRELLGYDLGVAITGHEQVGLTLVMTEGFGAIPMRAGTFKLLASRAGAKTSINGATQIRAGVMRPEIIIPWTGADETGASAPNAETGLEANSPVRIIRQPYFGMLGTVTSLPAELTAIPSGGKARVAKITLESGEAVVVPRANLEMIEE